MARIYVVELLERPPGWARHHVCANETMLATYIQQLAMKHPDYVEHIRLMLDDKAPEEARC